MSVGVVRIGVRVEMLDAQTDRTCHKEFGYQLPSVVGQKVVEAPYGMTQISTSTVAADVKATVSMGIGLSNFIKPYFKVISGCLLDFVLGNRPKMSIVR